MANEEGIVIELSDINNSSAIVRTTRSAACKSCSARNSCKQGHNPDEMEVKAVNITGAKVGDKVILNMKTSSLLKATFLLYIVPILSMLSGAWIGQSLGIKLHFEGSLSSVLFAFVFFVLSFIFVRRKGNDLSNKMEYKPKIVAVLKPARKLTPILNTNSSYKSI